MDPPHLPSYELGVEGEHRDRLVGLALSGVKTMTSSLLVHQQLDDEDLPLPGQRFALVDGRGRRGTVEIVEVRLLRLGDVGDDVAAGEGEDFRDAAHWRAVHEAFWSRWNAEVAQHLGREQWAPTDDDVVVVEVFRTDPLDVLAALGQAPEGADRAAFLAFVRSRGDDALWRSGGSEHLTASCFVFSSDLRQVLLTHHRKGGFWVQLGGHLEAGDASLADAARREGREESGIGDLQLQSDRVLDLDRHELHGGFTCAAHWDVGFVALAPPTAAVVVSPESVDVRWFPVRSLPPAVPPGFAARLAAVHARAAGLQPWTH